MDINNNNEISKNLSSRDYAIDVLRVIGSFLVILAHVDAPHLLYRLRTFDVVLLVFISGISFSYSKSKELSISNYLVYIKKRIIRLLIPTWLFLIFYFALFNFLYIVGISSKQFGMMEYIKSFLLIMGIGYVWIIRVYLLLAMEAPFLRAIKEKVPSFIIKIIIIFFSLAINEIICYFLKGKDEIVWEIIRIIVPYAIGYGIVFFWGLIVRDNNKKNNIIIAFAFLALFIIMEINYKGDGLSKFEFKFPPYALYLTYGLFASTLMYELLNLINIKKIFV